MKGHDLLLLACGIPGVRAFLSPTIHVASARYSGTNMRTSMAALDFSACPVNTAEALQRTTDLSVEGMQAKTKLALLGSTVRFVGIRSLTDAANSIVGWIAQPSGPVRRRESCDVRYHTSDDYQMFRGTIPVYHIM